MYQVYDFRCDNGHVTEEFVESTVTTSRCGCGADSTRMVSAPSFHLNGSDGSFPGAHMKGGKEHEKAGRKKSPQ